jgi:Family of unknown function (DUF6188)
MASNSSHKVMTRTKTPVDLGFLSGATITRVIFDQYAAGFVMDLGPAGGTYDWYVEQEFEFHAADAVATLRPDDRSSIIRLIAVLGQSVEEAKVDQQGHLQFKLTGGIGIECGHDDMYEAWKLEGPRAFLVVCLPGGGLATWTSEAR